MKYRLKVNHSVTCEARSVQSPSFGKLIVTSHPDNADAGQAYTPGEWSDVWEPVPDEPHPFVAWLTDFVQWLWTSRPIAGVADWTKYVNDHPPPSPPPDPRQPGEAMPEPIKPDITDELFALLSSMEFVCMIEAKTVRPKLLHAISEIHSLREVVRNLYEHHPTSAERDAK